MKKTFVKFSAFMLASILHGGCSGENISEELPTDDRSGYFVYAMEDVHSFDVDKEGNLYAAAFSSDTLKIYDPYGTELGEKTLPTPYHTAIGVRGSDIFTLSANELYRNDEKIYALDFEDTAKDIRIIGEDVYLLYAEGNADRSDAPMIDPLKGWNGEKLLRIQLPDLSASEVICGYPLLISSLEDELWVYGLNDEGGYIMPVRENEAGAPIPAGTEIPDGFSAVDHSGKYLYSRAAENSTLALCMTDPNTGQINELMPNAAVFDAGGIRSRDGYIYYLNSFAYAENSGRIERIRQSDYVKDNTPIRLLSADRFSYTPFGCGRSIVEKRLSDEEFALTVLSRDRGFDVCVLSSAQDFSRNFRDRGSFYTLNGVPGVSEYVERCFPALREAVTNSDGEIWALPLSMSVPCAIYNIENCREEGFSPNGLTLEEFITETDKLFSSDPTRRDICVSANAAIPLLLRRELSGEAALAGSAALTEKLRFIKSEMIGELFGVDVSIEANNNIYFDFGAGMLTMLADTKQKQLDFSVNGNIRAADLFEGKNPADCVFLCANPSSDNLAAVSEYITALCGYLSAKTDDFMLNDSALYSDTSYISELMEIYRDAEVFFRVPDEILLDPIRQYLREDVSLDELVAEADRKLSAYLNE